MTVTVTATTARAAIDQAYCAEYGRSGSAYVAPMTADSAAKAVSAMTVAKELFGST